MLNLKNLIFFRKNVNVGANIFFNVPKNAVLNIYQNPTRAATAGASIPMRTGAARWHHEPAAGPASAHQPHD